ncbi:MAG: type II toxin-antitoxin system PemK/MazF family toxin [Nostocaceae cyanobacterium]|nr:type II toxin-antitoxin system PemK/MazF family toxin [Nostocaceae cyanobacterium]
MAPITDWKQSFVHNLWHVKIEPDSNNGLTKASAIDALQLRGVDLQRFIRKLGNVSDITMSAIAIAIVTIIEAEV